jgi:hypothetical protein
MVIVKFMHPDVLYRRKLKFHSLLLKYIQGEIRFTNLILKFIQCDTDVYAELYRNLHRVTLKFIRLIQTFI